MTEKIRVTARIQKLDENIAYCIQHEKQSTNDKDKGYWRGYRRCLRDIERGVYK